MIVVDRIRENDKTQNAIPLFLSGRFYVTNTKVKPYVSLEWNHYYLLNQNDSILGRDYLIKQNGEKRLLAIGFSDGENGDALGIGFGVNTPVGKNRNLDLSLQFIDSNYTDNYVRFVAGYYISL